MSDPENARVSAGTDQQDDKDLTAFDDPVRTWYSRGYLPHCDERHLLQMITFRLVDSLPREKLRLLEDELRKLRDVRREELRRRRIEGWLDAGMGCCALRHPEVARYVQESFLHFHGERYHLHAWCIMPNHVHILIEPLAQLATIIQSWKSFTARRILARNEELQLGIPGKSLWMRDYWDRYIRDETHYLRAVAYIHRNPVAAGLCGSPEEWPWSSASARGNCLAGARVDRADGDVGAPRSEESSGSDDIPKREEHSGNEGGLG